MLQRHSPRPDYAAQESQEVASAGARSRRSYWIGWSALVVALIVMGAIGTEIYRSSPSADREANDAVRAAQGFVKERIGPKMVPHFAPREWVKVERDGELYRVTSWLEAAPSKGGAETTLEYLCEVTRYSDGRWYVAKLEFRRQ
jgi:hypothetical protein